MVAQRTFKGVMLLCGWPLALVELLLRYPLEDCLALGFGLLVLRAHGDVALVSVDGWRWFLTLTLRCRLAVTFISAV